VDAVSHDSKNWGRSSLNGEEQLPGGAVDRLPFVTPSGQNDELFSSRILRGVFSTTADLEDESLPPTRARVLGVVDSSRRQPG
jgi:hypothetical protein